MTTTLEVMNALKKVVDPEIHCNVVELNMVRDLIVGDDGDVSFTLALTIPAETLPTDVLNACVEALAQKQPETV